METGAFEPLSSYPGLGVHLTDSLRYLGPSLLSYRHGGTVWGLPIDAATQHAAYRADLMGRAGEALPESWEQTLTLGQRLSRHGLSLGVAIKTPHAILTIAALMANMGSPWETEQDRAFSMDESAFIEAFKMVKALLAHCPDEVLAWNAIDLHEAMAAGDGIAYCPCVYGYGTYGEVDIPKRLSFADFAGAVEPYHAGSVLGGTGLAVARASRSKDAAIAFVAFAASDEGQALMASKHGQPGLAAVWHDRDIDRRFNGFFSGARRSVEAAWLRPRYRGYIGFQAEAGELVAQALRDGDNAKTVWNSVSALFPAVNP